MLEGTFDFGFTWKDFLVFIFGYAEMTEMEKTIFRFIFLGAVWFGLGISNSSATVCYDLIDLGNNQASCAYSINNDGLAVGVINYSLTSSRAVRFDSSGDGNTILLSNYTSCAYAINNLGVIVGASAGFGGQFQAKAAALFDHTGNKNNTPLGSLGGSQGMARSINEDGLIVGQTADTANKNRAVWFEETQIPFFGIAYKAFSLASQGSCAWSVNNSGKIVGELISEQMFIQTQAMFFDPSGNGVNVNLGSLGGSSSSAYCINDSDQIVGFATTAEGQSYATLFDASGQGNNTNLGALSGMQSAAYAINNGGQIVGYSRSGSSDYHATLFAIVPGGNPIDLNTLIDPSLGWSLEAAFDINDNGWIVGYGTNPQGISSAYLLKPIPEPAGLVLLGAGWACLGRRKRRS